jgi:hypothetical protein
LSEGPTLDDLPDQVFVALGRRGMEGIPLKQCTYACNSEELELVEVKKDPPSISGVSLEVVIEDWLVKCSKCEGEFTIRQKVRYVDGERIDTMVSILDNRGNDLGWIGSY